MKEKETWERFWVLVTSEVTTAYLCPGFDVFALGKGGRCSVLLFQRILLL